MLWLDLLSRCRSILLMRPGWNWTSWSHHCSSITANASCSKASTMKWLNTAPLWYSSMKVRFEVEAHQQRSLSASLYCNYAGWLVWFCMGGVRVLCFLLSVHFGNVSWGHGFSQIPSLQGWNEQIRIMRFNVGNVDLVCFSIMHMLLIQRNKHSNNMYWLKSCRLKLKTRSSQYTLEKVRKRMTLLSKL